MQEQTLAIIKPDGIKYTSEIINMIYDAGLKIVNRKTELLDKEILKEHYAHLVNKPFYPTLENYMTSDYVILLILSGENAVEKLRKLMGPTDSTKAEKGTIRGEFGTNITYNVIHGSDSIENAKIEIDRFFNRKKLKLKK